MEEKNNNSEVIDLIEVFNTIWSKKKLFIKIWMITFVVSCILIFPVPRTYDASITLAPETNNLDEGSLSSIASSFGINIGNMSSSDAFYPEIYPDIMSSNEFIAELLDVKVKTIDGVIDTTYSAYLHKYQKKTFYLVPFKLAIKTVKKLFKPDEQQGGSVDSDNNRHSKFYFMTDVQDALFESVRSNVTCVVDKKTGIITISVTDQDPLVCAAIADSACLHLQNYIIRYRTNKARNDYEYYSSLAENAKADYDKSVENYAEYCDSHTNTIRQVVNSERDALENDMQLKLTTYNTLNTQLVAANAKIQESTPAFTLLQGAVVPYKPSGPKRMIFIVAMLFFATLGTSAYIFKREILNNIYK